MNILRRILMESLKYIVLINLILTGKSLICGGLPFTLTLSLVCPLLCGSLAVLTKRNKARGIR